MGKAEPLTGNLQGEYPKNERDNITKQELHFLQRTAHYILSGTDDDIKIAITAKEFLEISNDDE